VRIGAAKEILTTVAKGNFLSAINIATKATKPEMHLKMKSCSFSYIKIVKPIFWNNQKIKNYPKKTSEE